MTQARNHQAVNPQRVTASNRFAVKMHHPRFLPTSTASWTWQEIASGDLTHAEHSTSAPANPGLREPPGWLTAPGSSNQPSTIDVTAVRPNRPSAAGK